MKLWILRPNYVAPYNGLKRATTHLAATSQEHRANPFLFDKCTGHHTLHADQKTPRFELSALNRSAKTLPQDYRQFIFKQALILDSNKSFAS